MHSLARLIIAERSVIVMILINTAALITMGFTDPLLGKSGVETTALQQGTFEVAAWVDYGCVVYFLIESALKIRMHGWRVYWSSGWNRFDFVVVLLSTPVLLGPIAPVRSLSTFLALRLGRLFRLFRVMRFIPNREHLYNGMKRALRASVGVFLALMLINLVLSLGATQLFGRHAPQYFGNPAMSSYTMFQVFTLEGWNEIPEAVAKNSHWAIALLARVYFSGAVLVGGILGLSLANAVFVDEMTLDNTDHLEHKLDELMAEVRGLRQALKK